MFFVTPHADVISVTHHADVHTIHVHVAHLCPAAIPELTHGWHGRCRPSICDPGAPQKDRAGPRKLPEGSQASQARFEDLPALCSFREAGQPCFRPGVRLSSDTIIVPCAVQTRYEYEPLMTNALMLCKGGLLFKVPDRAALLRPIVGCQHLLCLSRPLRFECGSCVGMLSGQPMLLCPTKAAGKQASSSQGSVQALRQLSDGSGLIRA